MVSDYAAIRADNERRYGTDIGRIGPMLLADRYDDRTHFIFELLQNAEDALSRRPSWQGSRAVSFHLLENELCCTHSGKPFDDRDVRSICGIADSNKDLTEIGRFGIGFKSVYAFTDRPEVHSGDEDFTLESFVRPTAASAVARGSEETIILLPLKASDQTAREEIARGFRRLGPGTLLFLRQIEEIAWRVDGGPSGLYLRSQPEAMGDNVHRLAVIGQEEGKTDIEQVWLVFSHEVRTDGGVVAGHIEIAFSIAQEKKSDRWAVQGVSDSPLVAFFPTVLQTHLGFLVQGPYKTTPSRDNVPRSDPWNQQLVARTATLLVEALRWLRDRNMLDMAALRCLPLDRLKFGEGTMFLPLFEATWHALASEPLLPRFGSGYISAGNAKLARTQELRELFGATQLAGLFGHDGEIAWLSGDITHERTPELRQYLMSELEIVEITPETILPKLGKTFLEAQPDYWILKFYEFLAGQPALRRYFENLPLVRLASGMHVRARSNGQPEAFLPGAIETGFPTVSRAVCSTNEGRKFLESLGLTEPDPVDDVIRNVLPKYRGSEVTIEDRVYEADILRILKAFTTDSKTQREKLILALRDSVFLRAIDAGSGSKQWGKPGALYLATQRLKELFAGVAGVLLVDDSYTCLGGEEVRDLLEACGASRSLRPVQVDVDWKKLWKLRERAETTGTRSGENILDYELHGLDPLLRLLPILTPNERCRKAELLWESLSDLEQRQRTVFTGMYRGQYYGQRKSCEFESRFVEQLIDSPWVPDSNGELQRPEFIVFEKSGWKANPFLLSKIPFKPPIIETLAKEAGIEPGVLDLLKKLGVTSEAELRARLGVVDQRETSDDDSATANELTPNEALAKLFGGEPPKPTPPVPDPAGIESSGADGGGRGTGTGAKGGGQSGPGSGSGGAKRTPCRGGGRPFISYVATHPEEDEPDPDGLDQPARMALENSAIGLILGREPQLRRTPTHNPGFDLFEPGADGQPIRWIEVKAMTGSLVDRPVGLSHTQFECAREHGEAFWLYVVENAANAEQARLVRVQDPAGKARIFTFDRGWLNVAEVDADQ